MREFADIQHDRGRAYRRLQIGDRQANLQRAIACYEKALEVYTREEFPQEWADLQNDLGNIHRDLPGGDRQVNLQNAITCYEKTLQVYTPNSEIWALTQIHLGDTYLDLPAGDRQANLERAIRTYQSALQVYKLRDFPTTWAMAQFRLGEAFHNQLQGDRRTNLQNASTHYQAALQVYTRNAFPREWAMTQCSLGKLYYNLRNEDRSLPTGYSPEGEFGSPYAYPMGKAGHNRPPPNLEEAIFHYQGALHVYTREESPLEWAATQFALGNAYRTIPGDDSHDNLEQAITCYQNVLLVYTLETAPVEWARTLRGLGDSYRSLAPGDQQTNRKQASAYYEKALQVYTQQDFPAEWSAIQNNLKSIKGVQVGDRLNEAKILRSAGDVEASRNEQIAAMESYRQALAIFRQLRERDVEAETLCRIGDVQLAMGNGQRDSALQSYMQALVLFQEVKNVTGEARALRGIGDVNRAAAQENYLRASTLPLQAQNSPAIQRLLTESSKQNEEALQGYEQALDLFLSKGNNSSAEVVRQAIADLKQVRERRDQLQKRFNEWREMPGSNTTPPAYPPYAASPVTPMPSFAPGQAYGQAALPSSMGAMPAPPVPARKNKRGSIARTITSAVIALVLILGGIGTFLGISMNQAAQTANSRATAQANSNASATAAISASATAVSNSLYRPFTKLALSDPLTSSNSQWNSASGCQFTSGGYQVSAQAGFFQWCLNAHRFGELAYQVTMTI